MEHINFGSKMQQSEHFQKGVELFRKKHNLSTIYLEARKIIDDSGEELKPLPPVYYRWYKKLINKDEKKAITEHGESLNILSEEGIGKDKKYWVAFMAIKPPSDCLEIRSPEFEKAMMPEKEIKVAGLF